MYETTQRLVTLAIVLALTQASPANAQFGGLKLPGRSFSGAPDIDGFLVSTEAARELTRRSAVALLVAITKHDEALRIAEEQKAAEAITDPKEREAALRKVETDADAQLAAVDLDTTSRKLENSAVES